MARPASLLATALVLVLAGCASTPSAVEPLPPPPTTQERPPTTPAPVYSGVGLPAVDRGRSTTTTVQLGPGQANLNGTVLGPDGQPAANATVRIERLVEGASSSTDLATAGDGGWSLPGVLGGRYRIRAWRTPDLAVVQPAMVFLGATDTLPVELKLERHFGLTPVISIAPNPPVAGVPITLAVQISNRSVDTAGVVQGVPQASLGVVLDGGGWAVTTANPTLTDGSGRARWELVCRAAGSQPLRLIIGAQPFQLALPACNPPPTTTTTVPGTPTTTRPGGATTTTRPGGTTTTRPVATTTATTRRP